MKKKPLLFALLALAIVTSLTAGTLAVYTKSVNLSGDVKVMKFAFDAQGGSGTKVDAVKLAPTQSQTTGFYVSNSEDEKTFAEVDLNYTITVDIRDTAKTMTGLKAELLLDGSKTPLTVVGDGSGQLFTYSGTLAKDSVEIDKYQVKLTWEDAGNAVNVNGKTQSDVGSAAVTNSSGLKITVAATQATSTK